MNQPMPGDDLLRSLTQNWREVCEWILRLQKMSGDEHIVVDRSGGSIKISLASPPDTRWLKVTGASSISAGRWSYAVEVYHSPYDTTAIETATAHNAVEIPNTSSSQSGYPIVTADPQCGDVTGVERAPNGWYKIKGRAYFPDGEHYVYLFEWANIPVVEGPS